jgi:hypothetical protein
MKKIFIFFLIFTFLKHNAYAGDAGWNSITCYSASKRTILTILDRYFSPEMTVYTLVIDGAASVYNTSDSKINDEKVKRKKQIQDLKVMKDGQIVFSLISDELTIYNDPRKGTISENRYQKTPFVVKMQCDVYWPKP